MAQWVFKGTVTEDKVMNLRVEKYCEHLEDGKEKEEKGYRLARDILAVPWPDQILCKHCNLEGNGCNLVKSKFELTSSKDYKYSDVIVSYQKS